MAAKVKRAVAGARKSTDARRLTAKNPTTVASANATNYKAPKVAPVVKGKAGRPKKVK